MRRTIILGAVVASFPTVHLRAQDQPPGEPEIKQILRDCVEKQKRTPGIVVGLIDKDSRKIVCVGKSGLDFTNEPGGDTVFEIGSATKTFTALLLAKMAERGELNLDDPAGNLLPSSVKLPSRSGKQITLRHLATHTSGLPRLPNNFKSRDPENPYADYTMEQMYAFLNGCKLSRDPGEQYEYSNLGAGLLGHLLALKAGTNYEASVVKEICDPLKMSDTRIALTSEMKMRLARGHNSAGVAVKNWDIPTLAGAGAIRSTANDLLKFLAANLDPGESPLARAIEKTHVAQHGAGSPDMDIALGWHVRRGFGATFIWHNGGTGGYRSFIGFNQKERHGIVVLSNSECDIDDIGWHLLNPKFKLHDVHTRQAAKIDYRVYDDYVGRYKFPLAGEFVITRDGNRLLAKLGNQPAIEVFPESKTRFFYAVVDAQITFVKDESGAVTQLVLRQNGIDQTARKVK